MDISSVIGSAVAEDQQKQQRTTAAALSLLQRLPPQDLGADLDKFKEIAPHLEQSLAPYVNRPLKLKHDAEASKYFVACDYNCQDSMHRSPWTNKYVPPPLGGDIEEERLFRPSERLRRLESTFNEAFEAYTTSYYEGGVSSVYLWDLDEGYAGAFVVHKQLPKGFGDHRSGVWDAVHVLEVRESTRESTSSNYIEYKLSSSVLLHLEVVGGKTDQTELSAHVTKQAESRLDRRKQAGEDAQIIHVGGMIEDNESALRVNLESIFLAKQRTILDSMRVLDSGDRIRLPSPVGEDAIATPQKVNPI
eukprot:TRINITY_DN49496_c0_g1_i1.p1 TRINITY_DN49496_c0_g1~~TRINITY_DN49496_c0_g1_i1.p1  ORF type:complete len:317 (-),score=58.20 TRINITY_DN49496_c0_g1_i1:115-1029(-)